MKLILAVLSFLSATIAAPMQPALIENQTLKKLDETALNEFRQTKQQMMECAKKIKDYKHNKLVNYYDAFTELSNQNLNQIFSQEVMHSKIRELYNRITQQAAYQEALQKARAEKNMESWKSFRLLNGILLQKELANRGVFIPKIENTELYLEKNKDLSAESGRYVIAASYLIFHARQMQRNETGKDISQIILN